MISEHPVYLIIQDICMEIKMESLVVMSAAEVKISTWNNEKKKSWLYCKHPYIFTKNHQEKMSKRYHSEPSKAFWNVIFKYAITMMLHSLNTVHQ